VATDRKAVSNASITSNLDAAREARFLAESELVTRAQAGDKQAFGTLVGPYIRQAYYVARKITGNREDAEDAAQQSFLKAFAHIHQFQREAHFSSWLFRIAINEALMKVRKRRVESGVVSMEADALGNQPAVELEASGDTFHPETLYAQAETRRILREAIDDLRSTSRAVVWLMGLYERPTKDAAKVLCMSESAVKTRFLRARRQLRERLTPYFPDRARKALSPV
jgi:RNA polymerase sigma-70 factor, ECF subfamily